MSCVSSVLFVAVFVCVFLCLFFIVDLLLVCLCFCGYVLSVFLLFFCGGSCIYVSLSLVCL